MPPIHRALAFRPPCCPRCHINFFQSPRSYAAPMFRPLPPSKTCRLQWRARRWGRCHVPMYLPCCPPSSPPRCPHLFPLNITLPSPPPFLRPPPWFRAPLAATVNARGLRAVHAPLCGSYCKGPPPASAAERCRGFCTGARTCSPCTGAGRFNSHKRGWTSQVSNRLNSGCSCITEQPINGPSTGLTCRKCTETSCRNFATPFLPPRWMGSRLRQKRSAKNFSGIPGLIGNQIPNLHKIGTPVAPTHLTYPATL